MSELRIITGLGNPGLKYETTRHNLGFLVVRQLADNLKVNFQKSSLTSGWVAETTRKRQKICLLLPSTYMNNSGVAVRKLIVKKDVELKNFLVICDDFSLDFEQMRLRQKGSDGGHNGLYSIIDKLNENSFARLRLGIGSPPKGQDPADFVLEKFTNKEKQCLKNFIDEAAECCLVWLDNGINRAMELFNRRKENGKRNT